MIKDDAFNSIFERFRKEIEDTAYKYVADRELAEDIRQEVFQAFYDRMETIDCTDLEYVHSWLRVAVGYRVGDCVRKESREKEIMSRIIARETGPLNVRTAGLSPEDICIKNEEIKLRTKVFRDLKKKYPDDCEILLKVEYDEEKPEVVAKEYDISVNALYTRIYRFKLRLRNNYIREENAGFLL